MPVRLAPSVTLGTYSFALTLLYITFILEITWLSLRYLWA